MDVLFLRDIKKSFLGLSLIYNNIDKKNKQFLKTVYMTKKELITSLQKIIKPYVQDQEAFKNLSEETDFINDLKINSANLVDVILDVEDEFDIEIDNESMEKMLSVKAAMEIIETKLAKS